ncbi:MAG: MoaD/ThiS family protein [Candidatus Thorarchaeota archaeon]
MKISVRLYGELKERIEDDKTILELAPNSDIHRILSLLNLQLEEVVITLVNGKAKSLDYILENDDRIDIFPPLKGG